MSEAAVAAATLAGAVLGAVLVRPVVALYARPAPAPPAVVCALCGARVLGGGRRWVAALVRGRCGACRERFGAGPGVAEVVTAAVFGGVAAGGAGGWLMAAQFWFALVGSALVLVDVTVHRLPDHLTGAASAGLAVLLAGATVAGQPGSVAVRTVGGAAAVGALFFVAVLVGAVAFGDFKLSPALGMLLAWTSWRSVAAGLVLSVLLAPVLVLGRLVVRDLPGRRALRPVVLLVGLAVPAAAGLAASRASGVGALGAVAAWAVLVLEFTVVLLARRGLARHMRVAIGPALVVGTLLASVLLS
ncbi:prepilin peptidase [Kitasatospora sp. NPDC092948]|uniref:prepilin peptidase n=1 Tax=Kitasatospora sp. NPDC092948 TaxID=3364088 RepID=UPI0038275EBE